MYLRKGKNPNQAEEEGKFSEESEKKIKEGGGERTADAEVFPYSPQKGADIHAARREELHGGAGRHFLKDLQPVESPHRSSLVLKYCIPCEGSGEKYEKGPTERNS